MLPSNNSLDNRGSGSSRIAPETACFDPSPAYPALELLAEPPISDRSLRYRIYILS